MQISFRDVLVRLSWTLAVVAVYGGLYFALMWSLTNHPVLLILVIAVGGIPVLIVALKLYGREEQRRSAWSVVRSFADGSLSEVPDAPEDRTLIGIVFLEDVMFRAVSISVNEKGIRLDRPLRAVRPLVVPWKSIQRLDTNETGGELKLRNQDSTHGARIYLKNMERPISLYPWNTEFQKYVPANIGHEHLPLPE